MGQKIAQTYNRMKNESVEFFIISDGDFLKGAFAEGFEKSPIPLILQVPGLRQCTVVYKVSSLRRFHCMNRKPVNISKIKFTYLN